MSSRILVAHRLKLHAVVLVALLAVPALAVAAEPLQGAILIVFDTMRADRLSIYGAERDTTPNLRRLAEQGVVFDAAVTTAPWTLPAVGSLLSGRWVEGAFETKSERPQLAWSLVEAMGRAGIRTAAFTEGGFVSRYFGVDRGFAHFTEQASAVQVAGAPPSDEGTGSIERTFARARGWLDRNADEGRFFLLIHTYEAHTPYTRTRFVEGLAREEKPDPEQARVVLRALYDGGLWECDRHLGRLLDFLERKGLREKTLVVVTSDHGEELGDHYPAYAANHGHSLKDDLVRIPLVVSNPLEESDARRVPQQVRIIDVMPTIAELMRVRPGSPVDGRSLVLMMRGGETRDRPAFGGSTSIGPRRAFVRTGDHKYIEIVGEPEAPFEGTLPARQLYDLRADPGEQDNRAAGDAARAKALAARLAAQAPGAIDAPSAAELPDELAERLRALGYLE